MEKKISRLTNAQKNKAAFILLFLFFLLGIIQPTYSITKILLSGELPDFNVYYQAATAVLNDISPYGHENFTFNYPSASLFLFIPFSLIPLFHGQILWTIFSTFCLALSLYLLLKVLNGKPKKEEFLLLIPLITLSFPTKWTFGMGQINFLILFLLITTFFFYRQKKDLLAGVALGTAIVLKLTPLLLLGLFLLKRKGKVVINALMIVLLLSLLAVLIFGLEMTHDYFLNVLPSLMSSQGKWIYYNQATSGFVTRLMGESNLAFSLTTLFSLSILATALWLSAKSREITSLNFSLIIVTILLINSFSWQHHFVLTIFPFLAVLNLLREQKARRAPWLILLTSYLLISFNLKNPTLFQNNPLEPIILSHVFFGTLTLFAILVYYLIKENG